jgi:hypothetical protein
VARLLAFPFGQTMHKPSDKLDQTLASLMTTNNHYRDRLKQHVYLSNDPSQPVDRMEHALQLIIQSRELIQNNTDLKRLTAKQLKEKLEEKVKKKELTKQEMEQILDVEAARWDAILVDEFTFDSMKKKVFKSVIDSIKSPLR